MKTNIEDGRLDQAGPELQACLACSPSSSLLVEQDIKIEKRLDEQHENAALKYDDSEGRQHLLFIARECLKDDENKEAVSDALIEQQDEVSPTDDRQERCHHQEDAVFDAEMDSLLSMLSQTLTE
jgi:hypothetical protein